ncbi:MAG: lipocalin-like domain-containing protein, partial [Candidatus Competibacteraceae bacterium]|nr:lipocalin-like domain-containing protein [Candidatus Competibacteraceae bacterium]
MSKRLILMAAAAMALAVVLWLILATSTAPTRPPGPDLNALLGNPTGFEPVAGPWNYRFPADHGPHPGFHTENWYFTGHLQATAGRSFAFQLLLTRVGLKPGRPDRPSAWASHRLWRGQLVVTDLAAGRVYAFERFSRAALGLAGAKTRPLRVWLEDWTLSAGQEGSLQLSAGQGPVAVELTLDLLKPPARSAGPVGPFYGYAASRLAVRGTLNLAGRSWPVTGLAWLDRAWGALPLGGGAVARDRLLLQLDDGRELALSRLRRRDGSRPPIDTGMLIAADGSITVLERSQLEL